jgi:hypothetical protein
LCNWIIKLLRGEWADDPRAPAALRNYIGQLREIDARIREIKAKLREVAGEPSPPNQVVGMRALTMCGRAAGAGRRAKT